MQTADRGPLRTLFRLLSLSRPDVVPICGAFLFLVAAVIGEKLASGYVLNDYYCTLQPVFSVIFHYDCSLSCSIISGDMLMPAFTGQIIDALNSKFDSNAFASAIFFMGLTSFGG